MTQGQQTQEHKTYDAGLSLVGTQHNLLPGLRVCRRRITPALALRKLEVEPLLTVLDWFVLLCGCVELEDLKVCFLMPEELRPPPLVLETVCVLRDTGLFESFVELLLNSLNFDSRKVEMQRCVKCFRDVTRQKKERELHETAAECHDGLHRQRGWYSQKLTTLSANLYSFTPSIQSLSHVRPRHPEHRVEQISVQQIRFPRGEPLS